MKASEILNKAADLITPRFAWVRGTWGDRRFRRGAEVKCFCADGAILQAGVGNAWGQHNKDTTRAIDALSNVVGANVISWNDKQTDKRKVIRAMRKAAKVAAAAGD